MELQNEIDCHRCQKLLYAVNNIDRDTYHTGVMYQIVLLQYDNIYNERANRNENENLTHYLHSTSTVYIS